MAHFKFLKILGMNPQIDHDINFAKGNVLISLFPRTKLQQAAEIILCASPALGDARKPAAARNCCFSAT
jgi:hypothetical protein